MTEQQPISHQEQEYLDNLAMLERYFRVDLSRSKTVPFEQVLYARTLAEQYLSWLHTNGLTTNDQHTELLSYLENYLVFEEAEHREFRLAVKRKKVEIIDNINPALNFDHRAQLEQYEREAVPPGNVIHFWNSEGKMVPFVTLTALPYTESTPHNYLTVEGVVAEETMHIAANIQHIEQYPSVFLHYLEEAGVKYYSVDAMRGTGIADDAINAFHSFGGSQAGIWSDFIRRVGEPAAAETFFQGQADAATKMTLYECLR